MSKSSDPATHTSTRKGLHWSKIHLVYFALAAFDLIAIGSGLALSEWSKAEHEKTAKAVEQASVLRDYIRQSQNYTVSLSTIANDIFANRNVAASKLTLGNFHMQHGVVFSQHSLEMRLLNLSGGQKEGVQQKPLSLTLDQLDPAILAHFEELHKSNHKVTIDMINETRLTIDRFEAGDERTASEHMAKTDSLFRTALENTISATADLDREMNAIVAKSQKAFRTSTFWQYVVGGSILLMILLACGYAFTVGRVLKRKYLELETAHTDAQVYGSEVARINEDVTQLNKNLAENLEKLRVAQDDLVKKGRMEQLGQLTATIAHELRNPLGAVRTSSFLMKRKMEGKNLGFDQQISRIETGVERCDKIITQLLDFSRTKKVDSKTDDLDAWLEKVVTEESARLDANVSVTCDLGLSGLNIPFDPVRLQRAIVNLMSNAEEAMMRTKDFVAQAPAIHIVTRHVGEHVQISICDNGPGMAAEVLNKVREPLFTTKNFGTGLGIPAIEQIAAQHGGTLEIVSAQGQGATFTINLPIAILQEALVA